MKSYVRLAWLIFALVVAPLLWLPQILHAQAPVLAVCDNGWCMISEHALDLLLELAKKAGKNCV
jgi:hypothetical protein